MDNDFREEPRQRGVLCYSGGPVEPDVSSAAVPAFCGRQIRVYVASRRRRPS